MGATIIPLAGRRPKEPFAADPEPVFDPKRHVSLGIPDRTLRLRELGYTDAEAASRPTDLALTAPFRLLSPDGVTALEVLLMRHQVCDADPLAAAAVVEHVLGAKFLRDLAQAPALGGTLTDMAGVRLHPYPTPRLQGLAGPTSEPGRRWHGWSLGIDGFTCVVALGRPGQEPRSGGILDWFAGPRCEGARRFAEKLPLRPMKRMYFPEPGFAVLQHGPLVLHRLRGTVGPSPLFLLLDFVPDRTAAGVSAPAVNEQEDEERRVLQWALRKAECSHRKLADLLAAADAIRDRGALVGRLWEAVADAEQAIETLSSEAGGVDIHNRT